MLPRLAAAVALACVALLAHAQSEQSNLQNLLAALVDGTEATLVTPLTNGMLQVTSFQPAARMSAVDAAAAINRARSDLQARGEPQPTVEQIARMLAGGPIDLPSGRIQAVGILTASGRPAVIQSQVVAAGTPLQYSSAASGGTAPPVAAREQALKQLADIGIINPTEEQIRAALVGGTINTLNGVYQLPGILRR
jgi:hypothetical protein